MHGLPAHHGLDADDPMRKLLDVIRTPEGYSQDCRSIRFVPNLNKFAIMITYMPALNHEEYEHEISKRSLKLANPDLVPRFIKVDEIRGHHVIDVLFLCDRLPNSVIDSFVN
jgi:hypothetical protein